MTKYDTDVDVHDNDKCRLFKMKKINQKLEMYKLVGESHALWCCTCFCEKSECTVCVLLDYMSVYVKATRVQMSG